MPLYEYRCQKCNYNFELLRPVSEAAKRAECPRCHVEAERLISRFSCLSKTDSGVTTSIGGSSCASCGSGTCSTCGL